MNERQVSWLVVEKGWRVVAADGVDVGTVDRIAGDENLDIFDGLAVSTGTLRTPVYVPAEQVGPITDGTVKLKIQSAAVESLEPYREPPAVEEIVPEKASLTQRIAGWFRGPGR
jgi:hypothetical protein